MDKLSMVYLHGFPGGTSGKESACQCRRCKRGRFDPWVRKTPWRRLHGNPHQYSCLENPMDRGAWQATVHRVTKSQTQLKRLSRHAWPIYAMEYYSTIKRNKVLIHLLQHGWSLWLQRPHIIWFYLHIHMSRRGKPIGEISSWLGGVDWEGG